MASFGNVVHLPVFADHSKAQSQGWSPRKSNALEMVMGRKKGSSFRMQTVARAAATGGKSVWITTSSKEVMTSSVEAGWTTFLFTAQNKQLAEEWKGIARIMSLLVDENGDIIDMESKNKVGIVSSGKQLNEFKAFEAQAPIIVIESMDDWQIIPAENMVANFQGTNTLIFATASNATDAKVFLEALEKGTDGVVLKTEDSSQISQLREYFGMKKSKESNFQFTEGVISRVEAVGMGDRVCVDLCSLLSPGEGMLVGSFAKGLFLVHSECTESSYIASRPFRVNAGPVHAYVQVGGGRTLYLAELKSGDHVMVVNSQGQARTAIVGRVKIESRPLLLVEAEAVECKLSILLQNAETVSLVQPYDSSQEQQGAALPVTKMKVGNKVLLCLQEGARHTGIPIQEFIIEKVNS